MKIANTLFVAFVILVGMAFVPASVSVDADKYKMVGGLTSFMSNAPMEMIQAQTQQTSGLLRISSKAFAFSIPVATFDGFNSALQREHFNENYMESSKYPKASFSGSLVEGVNLSVTTPQLVNAKGTLTIHGVAKERVIPVTVIKQANGNLSVSSTFSVALADHSIAIPSIMAQKIATIVQVTVSGVFLPVVE